MTTQYRDVSWGDDEEITADKLNQMTTNEKYLLERIMPHQYQAYGITKTSGLKIACGIVSVGPYAGRQMSKVIYFGRFFTVGCRPIVLASHATPSQFRTFVSCKGVGANNMRPDHNGFQVVLNADPLTTTTNYFPTAQHIHWLSIGY